MELKLKYKGLRMLEIVVAIIMIGILLTFLFSYFSPHQPVRIDAAAQKVMADIQYARSLAISTSIWAGISFEVNPANTYYIYQIEGDSRTIIENPASLGKHFIINLSSYYNSILVDSVNVEGGNHLEFDPLGTPYFQKNGPPITVPATITLRYGPDTKTIEITPNTGKISIL
jgi:Tfp pilus assembly protein FimT